MDLAIKGTRQSAEYLAGDRIHQAWESDYLDPDLSRFYDAAFARIVRGLGARLGDAILDAGCGYCHHAARLARMGLKVTAVDFSPAALSAARANLEREGLFVDLRQADLLALPFPARSFPYVLCWGVLMHIPQVEAALLELIRVLQRGGRLALLENSRASLHVRLWEPFTLLMKRLAGRTVPRRQSTERGIEEWRSEGLLVRKIDLDWLTRFMAAQGLTLVDHAPGQFTEVYTALPNRLAKRLVYRFNLWWLRRNGSPSPALGQILVFEKS